MKPTFQTQPVNCFSPRAWLIFCSDCMSVERVFVDPLRYHVLRLTLCLNWRGGRAAVLGPF